jgi:hypothetical protein
VGDVTPKARTGDLSRIEHLAVETIFILFTDALLRGSDACCALYL